MAAILEVVALGTVNLAVLLVGALLLAGSCQGPAGVGSGNILAGVVNLGLLGGAGVAGFLDGKHGLALALLVTSQTLLCRGDNVFIFRVTSHTGVLARVLPSFFCSGTPISQNI